MAAGETYEEFVEKFKPKKTTDDCYTPPGVYAVIKDWACKEYGIDPAKIVRPFYPGGDYENFDYPEGAVVLDNPPFSILSRICGFYLDRGIPFFLFAPSLTALSGVWISKFTKKTALQFMRWMHNAPRGKRFLVQVCCCLTASPQSTPLSGSLRLKSLRLQNGNCPPGSVLLWSI